MQADVDFLETLLKGDARTMLKPPMQQKTKTLHEQANTSLSGTDLYIGSFGGGSSIGNTNRNASLEKYNALVQKYGTKNIAELITKVNQDIKSTTSEYRQTAIKSQRQQ